MGGDLNARTGEGDPIRESNGVEVKSRKSRDKIINREGKILIDKIIGRRIILNGSYEKEEGWTYVGEAGASVTKYAIANVEAEEEIRSVAQENREDSDHQPIEVEIRGPETVKSSRVRGRESEKTLERNVWTEKVIEFYHKQYENWHSMGEETNKLWEEIRNKVKSSMIKRQIRIGK